MTEEDQHHRPHHLSGSAFTPNNEVENCYWTTSAANLYYYANTQFYERTELSSLPEVGESGGRTSSAFRPVNPGEGKGAPNSSINTSLFGPSALSTTPGEICVMKGKKYNSRYPLPEKPRQKRAVIQDMVRPLKQWLVRHRHNPYPTKTEKVQLALGSNMTLVQVSNWFANARRRLKNVVQDHRCSWSKRLRMYNQFVQGNAELLSIASDDSIWNSEDEEGGESSPSCDNRHNTQLKTHHQPLLLQHEDEEEEEGGGDSLGRTPVSSADGHDLGVGVPSSPPLGKDGSPKYKTSILHRYLADSLESSPSFPQEKHYSPHLPIRPVPSRSREEERLLYKPYKVPRGKKTYELQSTDEDEDHLVVVDDDEDSSKPENDPEEEEKKEGNPGFPSLLGPHLSAPSFPLWHHPAFHHLAPPFFTPFLASSPHKDLLKLLYNDALLSRSKDLALNTASSLGHNSLPQEPIRSRNPDFPSPPNPPIKSSPELLNKLPPTQTPSSTPAIFI
eukprot:TRINITY_DN6971_c0_g1_i1.p1 TRINITY_DN6971_c0_g1~~TRINITY_DN6971_c0_g1_i1.p1  ORF type:complete len:503 (-),score=137.87 TRINITY_DN6971_c0_g1_i1:145-1653(-)